jgi:hypothetical protein
MTIVARASLAVVAASLLVASSAVAQEAPPALPPAPAPAPVPAPAPAPAPAAEPVADAPAAAAPPAEDAPPAPAPAHHGTVGRIDAGYTVRRLFDLDIGGVEGSLGVGGDPRPTMGAFGRITYGYGTSEYGLPVHVARLDGGLEAIVEERLRLGGSAGLGAIVIGRATRARSLWKLGLALGIHATYDLVVTDDLALYLGAHGDLDAYPHLEKEWAFRAVLLSAGLGVGVRF